VIIEICSAFIVSIKKVKAVSAVFGVKYISLRPGISFFWGRIYGEKNTKEELYINNAFKVCDVNKRVLCSITLETNSLYPCFKHVSNH